MSDPSQVNPAIPEFGEHKWISPNHTVVVLTFDNDDHTVTVYFPGEGQMVSTAGGWSKVMGWMMAFFTALQRLSPDESLAAVPRDVAKQLRSQLAMREVLGLLMNVFTPQELITSLPIVYVGLRDAGLAYEPPSEGDR